MDKTFIYSDILANHKEYSDQMGNLGWFQPKAPLETLSDVNYVKYINEPNAISCKTLVAYFPGCFAEFHVGHLDVVKQAVEHCKAITDDYLVVIAPANSDYTTEKYGKDSLFATNKYRYDRICSMLAGIEGNVAIDLNTMLNYKVDYNFTDLILDFITRQNVKYDDLVHVPRIVCGKDRDYFANLVTMSDKIDVFYMEDTTGASSSGHIRSVGNSKVAKKKLLLRCNNVNEYRLFRDYFQDEYQGIYLEFIEREVKDAKELHALINFDVTICKDYACFLPYVKVHRKFNNPLSSGDGHITEGNFEGLVVLDSDVFSGGTKNFIANLGGELYAIHDFSNNLDSFELLDFPDFYKDDFCYPFVDISSRCSMRAFDLAAHNNFAAFKAALKNIEG